MSNSVQTNVNKVKCVAALCDNSQFGFYDFRDALLLEVIDVKMSHGEVVETGCTCTVKSFYNTPGYNTNLDITRSFCG